MIVLPFVSEEEVEIMGIVNVESVCQSVGKLQVETIT
jgi:hypothetical protein